MTTLSLTDLQDKIFRLEGQALSMIDIAKILNTSIETVPISSSSDLDFFNLLRSKWASGALSTGWNPITQRLGEGLEAAGSANHLWEGHQWKTLRESLNI